MKRFLVAAMLVGIACHETTGVSPAVKLAFVVQPPNRITAGHTFPRVSVEIQDAAGNTVTTATNSVNLAINDSGPGRKLAGSVTVAAVRGVATFDDLRIDASSSYTLSATSPNLTSATSVGFDVVAGPAEKLVFTVQPSGTLAHAPIPFMVVAVQDALGNTVTDGRYAINLSFGANPPGNAILSPATPIFTVGGLAQFIGFTIDKPGTGYTLVASTFGLARAVSNQFDVTIGAASKLQFVDQPGTTAPGAVIAPAVTVGVTDIAGNVVASATNSVTISIGTNAGGGTLSGTTTATAVNGIATFSDLTVSNTGANYTLTAAASGLNPATSKSFIVRNPLVFTAVSAGYFHTCGITTGGVGYCWGENSSGQLGAIAGATTTPVQVSGQLNFVNIGAGRDHTCGATTGAAGYCWGESGSGRLGTDGTDHGSPGKVVGGFTFASTFGGYAHTCGVTTAGAGYCWGDNQFGELGNGTQGNNPTSSPSAVSGGRTFTMISPGRYFSCGLTTAGEAYCWGVNSEGELGDGSIVLGNVPRAVSGQLNFSMVSAGGFHACGLTPAGAAYCWGENTFGQLGNDHIGTTSMPVAVAGGLTFAMISAGNRHTCGVTTDGKAYCWGDNSSGNLGNGTTDSRALPGPVGGGLTFSSVSAGRFHSCGITTSGTLYCWGSNNNGQLGDGTTVMRLEPVLVR